MFITLFNTLRSTGVPCTLRELLDLIGNQSVYLEEYARGMIGQEELHALEVEKMLKSN